MDYELYTMGTCPISDNISPLQVTTVKNKKPWSQKIVVKKNFFLISLIIEQKQNSNVYLFPFIAIC